MILEILLLNSLNYSNNLCQSQNRSNLMISLKMVNRINQGKAACSRNFLGILLDKRWNLKVR
jgi:hypothetical protein